MKAIINDTHIGERGSCKITSESFLKFHTDQFLPYLEQHGIDEIIHAGDVFHYREWIDISILADWKKRFFDVLEERGIKMHIVCGNHDTYYKNTNSISSIEQFLSHYKNIKIYTEPEIVEFEDFSTLFLPWMTIENQERSMDMIKKAKTLGINYVFGHLEIVGFKLNSGVNCEHGMNRNVFKGFKRVMTGHFHSNSTQGNIFYLGSQYPMNWGDYGEVRGFHVFDGAKNTLERIENEDSLFHMIRYNDKTVVTEAVKGKVVKVIVDQRTDMKRYDAFIDQLTKFEPHSVDIVENLIDDTESKQNSVEAKDTLTIVHEYIDVLEGVEDKNYLKEMFSSLYTDAIEQMRLG